MRNRLLNLPFQRHESCHLSQIKKSPGRRELSFSSKWSCIDSSHYCILYLLTWWLRMVKMVKNLLAVSETWVWSLGWKTPWRHEWLPIPVFLPGEFHGQRSLVGYIQSMGSQRVRHNWATHTHTHKTLKSISAMSKHYGLFIFWSHHVSGLSNG